MTLHTLSSATRIYGVVAVVNIAVGGRDSLETYALSAAGRTSPTFGELLKVVFNRFIRHVFFSGSLAC